VTVFELDDARSGTRFMEHRVRQQRALPQAAADELIARLALDRSYVDGDYGGLWAHSAGVRLARGGASFDFMYNAGHVFLTPAGHDGAWAVVSADMIELLELVHPR
jgi:hypothetical protein